MIVGPAVRNLFFYTQLYMALYTDNFEPTIMLASMMMIAVVCYWFVIEDYLI